MRLNNREDDHLRLGIPGWFWARRLGLRPQRACVGLQVGQGGGRRLEAPVFVEPKIPGSGSGSGSGRSFGFGFEWSVEAVRSHG